MFFSKLNSGACTPMTTRPWSLYFSAHARTYGRVRRQLMHVYVQKSTKITLPLTALSVTGGELTHSVAPWSKRASVRWAAGFIGFSSEPPVPVLARNAIPVNVPAVGFCGRSSYRDDHITPAQPFNCTAIDVPLSVARP